MRISTPFSFSRRAHPEEHGAVELDAERAPALVAVAGAEAVGIDAAGDANHAGGVGVVVTGEQVVLVATGRDDGVGRGGKLAFAADAFARLLLGDARPVLHLAEGVEHDEVGSVLRPCEGLPRGDRLPVVAVHEVVRQAFVGGEAVHLGDERGHVGSQQGLVERRRRTGGKLHEPQVGRERRDLRSLALQAREDVDVVPQPGKLSRKLVDVHVHPAGVPPAERGHGIRVVGDLRDSP